MSAYALTQDVEEVWRPLSTAEQGVAFALLGYASDMIRQTVPRVDAWLADGSLAPSAAKYVAVQMVHRFLLNPEGLRQFTRSVDDFTEGGTRDNTLSAGGLNLGEDLLAWLRPVGTTPQGAFTIRPAGNSARSHDAETHRVTYQ